MPKEKLTIPVATPEPELEPLGGKYIAVSLNSIDAFNYLARAYQVLPTKIKIWRYQARESLSYCYH